MKEGYTPAELSKNLSHFIDTYAKENEGHPGCPSECKEICQSHGLRELSDLRMLAKRTWLGLYFPAKVALAFENALESPTMVEEFKRIERAEAEKVKWIKVVTSNGEPPKGKTELNFPRLAETLQRGKHAFNSGRWRGINEEWEQLWQELGPQAATTKLNDKMFVKVETQDASGGNHVEYFIPDPYQKKKPWIGTCACGHSNTEPRLSLSLARALALRSRGAHSRCM